MFWRAGVEVVAAREQEVVGLGGVELGVVVADPVDRPGVDDVLDRVVQHPHVGDQPQEQQGRQDGEDEHQEDVPEPQLLGDQGQGHQTARQRPQVQRAAAVAVADGDGPGRLEGEVLGGQGQQDGLPVTVAGRGRPVRAEGLELEP
jgi:hypothetical protein